MIEKIRREIILEEFDYQTLVHSLKDYSYPRDKITSLLRSKFIIRIKKGLYIFGDDYRHRAYSKELLANLIYGPSYISLESALNYYSLIPERVEAITSMTSKHAKKYYTPIGVFLYKTIPINAFSIGIERIEVNNEYAFLIAMPEKAISDMVYKEKALGFRSLKDIHNYLIYNLRIDLKALENMNHELIYDIAKKYKSKKVELLSKFIKRLMKG